MTVAYLVLAHEAPAQLGRLVGALDTPSSATFVHVDRTSDLSPFVDAVGARAAFTRERIAVTWGHFTQVEAVLVLLREAMNDPRRFDRFVLISGVDHPLRPAASIERFFAERANREFINLTPMPDDAGGKPLSRLTTYQPRPRHGPLGAPAWKAAMAVARRIHRRDHVAHLRGLTPFGGSTWWALTRPAAAHVLQFVRHETEIVDFFRHVVSPDESFVHTVIGNSPFRPDVVPNVTYADWSSGGARPAVLGGARLTDLVGRADADDLLFARKFADEDGATIAELDQLTGAGGAAVGGEQRA